MRELTSKHKIFVSLFYMNEKCCVCVCVCHIWIERKSTFVIFHQSSHLKFAAHHVFVCLEEPNSQQPQDDYNIKRIKYSTNKYQIFLILKYRALVTVTLNVIEHWYLKA